MSQLQIVILAGGLGKRMESSLPKVLHLVQDKPMCVHVLEKAIQLNPQHIYIVVGKYKEIIQETIQKYISFDNLVFVNQEIPQGTGHALLCAKDELLKNNKKDKVLVLCGDVPLLSLTTMNKMIQETYCQASLLTTSYDNPHGYGRIITNKDNVFQKIVEEKDCNEEQRKINLVNGGVYCFELGILCEYLPKITNQNSQNEYYLTDIFELFEKSSSINMIFLQDNKELIGINTKEQLKYVNLFF